MSKYKTEMERMGEQLIRSLNSRIKELKKQSLPKNKYLTEDYRKRMKKGANKLKVGYVRAEEQLKSVTSKKYVTNKREFRKLFKATDKMNLGYKVLDKIMELEPSIKTLDSNVKESLVNTINENILTKEPEEISKIIEEQLENQRIHISDISSAFDGLDI